MVSENVVQSTIHFQKRIAKLFTLMKYDFFKGTNQTHHVSSYFYRIEFQQRGAPHVHSLLWMKNEKNEDAPNFWIDPNDKDQTSSNPDQNLSETDQNTDNDGIQKRIKEIESFADFLITTSPEEIHCDQHENFTDINDEYNEITRKSKEISDS